MVSSTSYFSIGEFPQYIYFYNVLLNRSESEIYFFENFKIIGTLFDINFLDKCGRCIFHVSPYDQPYFLRVHLPETFLVV